MINIIYSRKNEVFQEHISYAQSMISCFTKPYEVVFVIKKTVKHQDPHNLFLWILQAVPVSWSRKHLPARPVEVVLRLTGSTETWRLRYRHQMSRNCGVFTGDWKMFSLQNSLQAFDVCVFEPTSDEELDLIQKTEYSTITMNVTIFRVQEVSEANSWRSRPKREIRVKAFVFSLLFCFVFRLLGLRFNWKKSCVWSTWCHNLLAKEQLNIFLYILCYWKVITKRDMFIVLFEGFYFLPSLLENMFNGLLFGKQ